MAVGLNVTATVHYDSTIIDKVEVKHSVIDSKYSIKTDFWDWAIDYALKAYGKDYTIDMAVEKLVDIHNKANITFINTKVNF